jgi:hypothetical protein
MQHPAAADHRVDAAGVAQSRAIAASPQASAS